MSEDPEADAEPRDAAADADASDPETGAESGADTDEADEAEAEDGLQDGDVIRLAYTARTAEDGTLVDTTDPEVAEEEGLGEEGREFEPRVIVLGAGHMFASLEEQLVGGEVGNTGTVTIPPEEAFGEYDDDQVRTVSANKIDEDDRYPGAQVTIDGEQGMVETIVGGRARVDFNHPLAGDHIEYEYEVVGTVDDPVEQARGMMDLFLDVDLEMWIETDEVEEERLVEPDEVEDEGDAEAEDEAEAEGDEVEADDEGEDEDGDGEDIDVPEPEYETVTVEKETLYIESTPQLSMNQQWLFQKRQICQQIMDQIGVDRVIVQETIDGTGMGMGMPGMMGGGMGGGDVEEALEEADVDADEIVEELGEE